MIFRITIGVPASGKSTLCADWQAQGEVDVVVCPDKIREELTGDIANQSMNSQVWSEAYQQVIECLKAEVNVVLDATNLRPRDRKQALDIANQFNIDCDAYLLCTPHDVAKERNILRPRSVPDDVMERMFDRYVQNCQPSRLKAEGFNVFVIKYEPGGP